MSSRMTNGQRRLIIKNLLIHTFCEECKDLELEMEKFARKTYDSVFSQSTLKLIRKIPKGYLPTTTSISVQFGSEHVELFFNGYIQDLPLRTRSYWDENGVKVALPIPAKMKNSVAMIFDRKSKITSEYELLKGKVESVKKRYDDAKTQASSAVYSVTTFGALIKAWPEIEPFVPDANVSKNLPVLPSDQLNAMFKLPVKKGEAGSKKTRQ